MKRFTNLRGPIIFLNDKGEGLIEIARSGQPVETRATRSQGAAANDSESKP